MRVRPVCRDRRGCVSNYRPETEAGESAPGAAGAAGAAVEGHGMFERACIWMVTREWTDGRRRSS